MIVAAGVILMAFFPDEAQLQAQALVRDHVIGQVELRTPTLLMYEMKRFAPGYPTRARDRRDRGGDTGLHRGPGYHD